VPGGTIIGLNLSVPVFKGLSQRSRLQQAELNFKKLETSQKQAEQGIALQSSQSFIAYKASLNAFQQSKESLQLAQRIRDKARIKFKEGVGSSVELLQAENEFLSAQGVYIESVRELMDNRVSLDKNLNKF
jgi:outer membrane protein TolC